jgi:hypothetical protein
MLFHDRSLQSYHYEKEDMGYAKKGRHAQESMMKKTKEKK